MNKIAGKMEKKRGVGKLMSMAQRLRKKRWFIAPNRLNAPIVYFFF